MYTTWKDEGIKYWDIAPKLFAPSGTQEMVPFLGAGVSVSDRIATEKEPKTRYPSDDDISKIAELAGVAGNARLYLEYAVRTAIRMQAWEDANGAPLGREEFRKKLVAEAYPPFVWELSELFSQLAPYTSLQEKAVQALEKKQLLSAARMAECKERLIPMLKLLTSTTEVINSLDPLTSIASYYENSSERKDLWKHLYEIIAAKSTPTMTHELIAAAAKSHLSVDEPEDYLILTTNYDILMEKALDAQGTPYVVLWRNRYDGRIYSRLANVEPAQQKKFQDRNPPVYPGSLHISKNLPSVILYKMHGCLHPDRKPEDDSLVITDADYVEFISEMTNIVPAQIGSMLPKKRLLFLGYSFSDWNVRSIYETVVRRTTRSAEEKVQDYAITRYLSKYEETYFRNRDIIIVLENLSDFVKGIRTLGGVTLP